MTGQSPQPTVTAGALIGALCLGLIGLCLGFEVQSFGHGSAGRQVFRSWAELDLLQASLGVLLGGVIGWYLGGMAERLAVRLCGARGKHIAGASIGALGGLTLGAIMGALAGARPEVITQGNSLSMDPDVDLGVLIVGALCGALVGALAAWGILNLVPVSKPIAQP